MVEDGLVKCNDCADGFKKEDTIFECGNCNEIFCDTCWETHDCLEDEYETATVMCNICSGDYDANEVEYCSQCGENVCYDCKDEHSRKHLEDDVMEHDYEDYVENEVKNSI